MKFLKQKNISRFSITDNTLFVTSTGRAVMDLTGALRLPKGTGDDTFADGTAENQRPLTSGVSAPNGATGYIRYNTTTHSIEAYIGAPGNENWEVVRAPGELAIRKQTLGPGNGADEIFGPLAEAMPLGITDPYDYPIVVLVENVIQISQTNYTILPNYLGSGNDYIEFTSPVPLGKNITIYYGFGN
jgi:hypothetical protein